MISVNVALGIGLIVLFVVSVYNHMAARKRDLDMARVIHKIDELLQAWAEHWGEPPDELRPILAAIINKWKGGRRIDDKTPEFLKAIF